MLHKSVNRNIAAFVLTDISFAYRFFINYCLGSALLYCHKIDKRNQKLDTITFPLILLPVIDFDSRLEVESLIIVDLCTQSNCAPLLQMEVTVPFSSYKYLRFLALFAGLLGLVIT